VTSLVELTGAATIAVDGAGNLFSDLLRGAVELPAGCSNDGCVISLTGGHDSLTSGTLLQATVDASGNVYYATESSTIVVLPAGCRSSSCVTTMGGGFGSVAGVALDAGGSVYASDNTNGTVSVVPPGCTSSSCVTLLQSGLTRLGGIALDGNASECSGLASAQ
jgi:DNA-binding beta-propeller fold protein YncE